MKFLKQFIIAAVASCVLAAGALAFEPQKNNDPKPPPKDTKQVPSQPKNPPPPRDNGSKGGNDNKRGKP